MDLEWRACREPVELVTETPGSHPEDGDLISYISWGNLGFYYDTSDIGYSDQTIHLGTFTAAVGGTLNCCRTGTSPSASLTIGQPTIIGR